MALMSSPIPTTETNASKMLKEHSAIPASLAFCLWRNPFTLLMVIRVSNLRMWCFSQWSWTLRPAFTMAFSTVSSARVWLFLVAWISFSLVLRMAELRSKEDLPCKAPTLLQLRLKPFVDKAKMPTQTTIAVASATAVFFNVDRFIWIGTSASSSLPSSRFSTCLKPDMLIVRWEKGASQQLVREVGRDLRAQMACWSQIVSRFSRSMLLGRRSGSIKRVSQEDMQEVPRTYLTVTFHTQRYPIRQLNSKIQWWEDNHFVQSLQLNSATKP